MIPPIFLFKLWFFFHEDIARGHFSRIAETGLLPHAVHVSHESYTSRPLLPPCTSTRRSYRDIVYIFPPRCPGVSQRSDEFALNTRRHQIPLKTVCRRRQGHWVQNSHQFRRHHPVTSSFGSLGTKIHRLASPSEAGTSFLSSSLDVVF